MKKLAINKKVNLISRRVNIVIDSLENAKVPFLYFVLTYLFAITLRCFIELLAAHGAISLIISTHYYLMYTALALSLIILFHLATKASITKVAKVILPCFMVLVLAPSLDFLISGGKGLVMTYLLPGVHDDLFWRFLTFFGDFTEMGVTPGIRIEIALVLLASFLYFFTRSSRLIKSICFTFLTYAILFTFAIIPFVVKAIMGLLGLEFSPSNILMTNFYATAIFILGVMIAYLGNRAYFVSIIKDIRLLRVVYYLSMFALGIAVGASNTVFELAATNIFHFLFIPISLVFAILFSIVTNNIADYEIDYTLGSNRPLVKGNISLDIYQKLAWIFLGVAMVYAALVNFTTLFLITLFIGNYFLYSMPPLRLKRITFFSKLAISINSLALAILGFLTITGSIHN